MGIWNLVSYAFAALSKVQYVLMVQVNFAAPKVDENMNIRAV